MSSELDAASQTTAAAEATAHFAAHLRFETDPSDVYEAQKRGDTFVLIDVRSTAAWQQGRIQGALHMPYQEMTQRAPLELDPSVPVVVYCWSPGCNAAHKGALILSQLGYAVRDMIGGYEYWVRSGQPVVDDAGSQQRVFDPLTMAVQAKE